MDRRSSKPEVLCELRKRTVAMKQQGKSHAEIAMALAIGESTSRLYWSLYRKGGVKALELRRRGRPLGQKRRLSARQERAIQGADHRQDSRSTQDAFRSVDA